MNDLNLGGVELWKGGELIVREVEFGELGVVGLEEVLELGDVVVAQVDLLQLWHVDQGWHLAELVVVQVELDEVGELRLHEIVNRCEVIV